MVDIPDIFSPISALSFAYTSALLYDPPTIYLNLICGNSFDEVSLAGSRLDEFVGL